MAFICGLAFHSRKYVRDVADFLAAGRVAGRYVLCVNGLEGGLGVITLIAGIEVQYQTGFAMGFWNGILLPLMMVLGLTGFINYRFRETKILSLGQFLEMRYDRPFRVFATVLRLFSEILCNCIGPAVAARFFIYLVGFPQSVEIFGVPVQTFLLLVLALLLLAIFLIMTGGTISLLITGCLQGLMSYPIFVIFTVFVLTEFSWFGEITPVMGDRIAGESFLNPYDVKELRDFNLFALVVSIMGQVLNRGVWYGGGASSSAKSAHEQKMSGILATYAAGFAWVMCTLMAVSVIAFMTHRNFGEQAHEVRTALSAGVAEEVVVDGAVRKKLTEAVSHVATAPHQIGISEPLSQKNNPDMPYLDAVHRVLSENENKEGEGNAVFQEFRSLYYQMMMPSVFRKIMPPVLLSLFVLLGIMLMISTDDARIFSAAMTIVQDLIVPFRKTPFSGRQHIFWIKAMIVFVALCFLVGSMYMAQLDYINLFCIISTSIWCGGAGSVVTFGLYSKRGTTAGAYAAILFGALVSGGGMLVQRMWADTIYPMLYRNDLVAAVGGLLETVSSPFNPYIVWTMDPVKFPINSNELMFLAMTGSIAAYWLVSFLTCRKPFNLERMLHRGIYNIDGEDKRREPFRWSQLMNYFISITPEYTKGDKILTWSVFLYTFVYQFLICFVLVAVWNCFLPWPKSWWGINFYVTNLLVPALIGVISTVWFLIGGVIDLRRLFRDLKNRSLNPLDNGMVDGHVALSEKQEFEKIEDDPRN